MAVSDLSSRLAKIQKSAPAKTVHQQTAMVVKPSPTTSKGKKPGPKASWKQKGAHYVRIYTQLQEKDRNTLKSSIHGGVLTDQFETVDHFLNEAVVKLMREYGLGTAQQSTID